MEKIWIGSRLIHLSEDGRGSRAGATAERARQPDRLSRSRTDEISGLVSGFAGPARVIDIHKPGTRQRFPHAVDIQ